LALLVGAGVIYFGDVVGSKTSTTQPTSAVSSSGSTTTPTSASPCSQVPLRQSSRNSVLPNGTGSAEIDYPVFAVAPGSTVTVCFSYVNTSNASLSAFPVTAYNWENTPIPSNQISISENLSNQSIPPHSNATAVYTMKVSDSAAGAYDFGPYLMFGENDECYQKLLVTTNSSSASFSDFPDLFGTITEEPPGPFCFSTAPQISANLTGFGGMSMLYLKYNMRFSIPFHETSRTIQSTVLSPTEQNITVKLGIESFGIPVTVEFLTNPFKDYAYMVQWANDPQESPVTGDPCDWNSSSNLNPDNELSVPLSGVTVSAPTLNLQPYSNGTFTFSVLVDNLTQGYAGGIGSTKYVIGGYYAALFSAYANWGESATYADLALTSYFPVGPIGQSVSGACPAPSESNFTNLPWYLTGLQPY